MKKAVMQRLIESGTPVAVGKGFGGEYPTHARKAVILAVGESRRVYSGRRYDIGGHAAHDGVRVRFEQPVEHDRYSKPLVRSGRMSGNTYEDVPLGVCVVGPREVIDTWDDYERKSASAARQLQETRERRERVANDARALAQALTDAGVPAEVDYVPGYRGAQGYYRGVTLSSQAARALLERLGSGVAS